jgi:drug/metabolite transporter (DMT)-like permease
MKGNSSIYILIALISALLFGISIPLMKQIIDVASPFKLAGLLYLGAATGTAPFYYRKSSATGIRSVRGKGRYYLSGAIVFGGIIGPVLLMLGLKFALASSVSLWLNLELVATAILGVVLFREQLSLYGWTGVAGTLFASVLISHFETNIGFISLVFIVGACLCWGIDNHLTALIDNLNPSQSTFWKGLIAGVFNLSTGFLIEPDAIALNNVLLILLIGVFSYGLSISLYITAAQNMGAIRSQMLFGTAPFFGILISFLFFESPPTIIQITAITILSMSLIALFRDQHVHEHTHEAIEHKHWHSHDDHHHDHGHPTPKSWKYHSHWHRHERITHAHAHWPDLHHRHSHDKNETKTISGRD